MCYFKGQSGFTAINFHLKMFILLKQSNLTIGMNNETAIQAWVIRLPKNIVIHKLQKYFCYTIWKTECKQMPKCERVRSLHSPVNFSNCRNPNKRLILPLSWATSLEAWGWTDWDGTVVVSRYGRGGSAKEIQNDINERGMKSLLKIKSYLWKARM